MEFGRNRKITPTLLSFHPRVREANEILRTHAEKLRLDARSQGDRRLERTAVSFIRAGGIDLSPKNITQRQRGQE